LRTDDVVKAAEKTEGSATSAAKPKVLPILPFAVCHIDRMGDISMCFFEISRRFALSR
jgi:hypothetical protein